jgi:hypothetical protein
MRSVTQLLATSLFVICAASVVRADTRSNPYAPIVARNPFGIKDPPPAPVEQPPPTAPLNLPKVILTGITTMLGPKPQALFEVTQQEQGKAAIVTKPIIREGEKDGEIEVLSIDMAKSMVRIRNGPVETNITFEIAKATPGGPTLAANTGVGVPPASAAAHPAYPGLSPAAAAVFNPAANTSSTYHDGTRGAGVTTYGANANEKTLPLRQVRTDLPGFQPTPETSTSTGSELLRSTARARGLGFQPGASPVPPLPAPAAPR